MDFYFQNFDTLMSQKYVFIISGNLFTKEAGKKLLSLAGFENIILFFMLKFKVFFLVIWKIDTFPAKVFLGRKQIFCL